MKSKTTAASDRDADGAAGRVAHLDWKSIATELDGHGCAAIGPLITPEQCVELAACYDTPGIFRSQLFQPNADGPRHSGKAPRRAQHERAVLTASMLDLRRCEDWSVPLSIRPSNGWQNHSLEPPFAAPQQATPPPLWQRKTPSSYAISLPFVDAP